jgi:putative CocE/NonD family hydrolase
MNLCDGILRLRYRDSWENPALLEPGRIYEVEVELFATANRFKAGRRIRIDIASSKFPQFDVNPNSGEPEGEGRAWRVATNRLWLDPEHASHMLLPIAPSNGA